MDRFEILLGKPIEPEKKDPSPDVPLLPRLFKFEEGKKNRVFFLNNFAYSKIHFFGGPVLCTEGVCCSGGAIPTPCYVGLMAIYRGRGKKVDLVPYRFGLKIFHELSRILTTGSMNDLIVECQKQDFQLLKYSKCRRNRLSESEKKELLKDNAFLLENLPEYLGKTLKDHEILLLRNQIQNMQITGTRIDA